ncbi:MAG TPA: HAMP domain-containing sensor histidine kinase, partial [Acidimicrobiales bacterium]|nr:HAMP domain-containing sensor histidine kinase [Acidimicrobiales bacterium]
RIEDEAERMKLLVDDLMLLARLDQGRELERQEVNLVAVSADAVGDASVIDPMRDVELDARGTVVVMGDENRLRQLVSNLVSNALTHTSHDSAVKVSVYAMSNSARIEVWDNGPGISPELLPHVFERFASGENFYRLRENPNEGKHDDGGNGIESKSNRIKNTGTGLGLSIVKAITDAHDGRVWVTSTADVGTTFYVELPVGFPSMA